MAFVHYIPFHIIPVVPQPLDEFVRCWSFKRLLHTLRHLPRDIFIPARLYIIPILRLSGDCPTLPLSLFF